MPAEGPTWDEAAEDLAGSVRDAIAALLDAGVSADDGSPEARLLADLRAAMAAWDDARP